jgi:hypothetical protein
MFFFKKVVVQAFDNGKHHTLNKYACTRWQVPDDPPISHCYVHFMRKKKQRYIIRQCVSRIRRAWVMKTRKRWKEEEESYVHARKHGGT